MVEISREERIEHVVDSYYRATAGVFYFLQGECWKESGSREKVEAALRSLKNIGFEVDMERHTVSRVKSLRDNLHRAREDKEVIEKVVGIEDLDPFLQKDVFEYVMMMMMDNGQFERYLDAQRNLRRCLLSGSGKGG